MRKAFLGLAPLLLSMGAGAAAQAPAWQVSEVSGDVQVVERGRSRAATRGQLLSSGSTIATAARARAVLVRGQEYVVISPASRLRVPDQPQGQGGIIQMLSDWGTALFRIERRATPHFGVQTPYLAAVVKGTVFTVTVGEAGASVQVTEGAVEVSTLDGGAAELVRPGMLISVSAADLQQLNVEGESNRSIRSNGTPIPGVVTVPSTQTSAYEGPSGRTIEILAPVTEGQVSLAAATGGLLEGSLGFELASADVIDQVREIERAAEGGLPTDLPPSQPVDDGAVNSPAPPGGDLGAGDPPADDGAGPPTPPGDDAGPLPPGDNVTPPGDGSIDPPTSPPGDDGASPPTDPSSDDDASPPSEDDGDNGHGNDDDGDDGSNPGNGGPGGPPTSPPGGDNGDGGAAGGDDDGNNGHGNDDDDDDGSNPGNGGPGGPPTSPPSGDDGDDGSADDGNNGHGNDDDGDDGSNPGNGGPPTSPPGRDDDDDGGITICLPADLLCIGLGGGDDDDRGGRGRGGRNDDD